MELLMPPLAIQPESYLPLNSVLFEAISCCEKNLEHMLLWISQISFPNAFWGGIISNQLC